MLMSNWQTDLILYGRPMAVKLFSSNIRKDHLILLFQLLRVSPVRNSLALVFREPGVYPFMKYVNSKADDRHYYVINCSFYGFH